MSELPELQPSQRSLWDLICFNFPADILRTLEDTEHVHSDELHQLYAILQSCHRKTPSHLIAKLAGLPQPVAEQMVDALHAHDITSPSGEDEDTRTTRESKPYFYSRQREEAWHCVLDLFEMGYLGRHADGSMREKVSDFYTLHILYRLEMGDKQSRRDEDTHVQNPAHCWYHETSDQNIDWCLRRLVPLIAEPWHMVAQEDGQDEEAIAKWKDCP